MLSSLSKNRLINRVFALRVNVHSFASRIEGSYEILKKEKNALLKVKENA